MEKCSKFFIIASSITAIFFGFMFYELKCDNDDFNIVKLIIVGIGLLLYFAGLILGLFYDRWCVFKVDLKQEEIDKLKEEYEKKKKFFAEQSEENEKRRAFEGRLKPEQQILEIIKAAKLSSKTTKETIKEPKEEKSTKVTEKEFNENEKFDTKIYEKALEELKNMNENNTK